MWHVIAEGKTWTNADEIRNFFEFAEINRGDRIRLNDVEVNILFRYGIRYRELNLHLRRNYRKYRASDYSRGNPASLPQQLLLVFSLFRCCIFLIDPFKKRKRGD